MLHEYTHIYTYIYTMYTCIHLYIHACMHTCTIIYGQISSEICNRTANVEIFYHKHTDTVSYNMWDVYACAGSSQESDGQRLAEAFVDWPQQVGSRSGGIYECVRKCDIYIMWLHMCVYVHLRVFAYIHWQKDENMRVPEELCAGTWVKNTFSWAYACTNRIYNRVETSYKDILCSEIIRAPISRNKFKFMWKKTSERENECGQRLHSWRILEAAELS